MKVKVNKEDCIGCGACHAIAPEVFEMDDEGFATVIVDVVDKGMEDDVRDAVEGCPTSAIVYIEE